MKPLNAILVLTVGTLRELNSPVNDDVVAVRFK